MATICPRCWLFMKPHRFLSLVRCANVYCTEFDKPCIQVMRAARVATEKTEQPQSCRSAPDHGLMSAKGLRRG